MGWKLTIKRRRYEPVPVGAAVPVGPAAGVAGAVEAGGVATGAGTVAAGAEACGAGCVEVGAGDEAAEGAAPTPVTRSAISAGVLNIFTAAAQSKIQMAATTMVTRVNTSPAFVPKALWPPMPPSAP